MMTARWIALILAAICIGGGGAHAQGGGRRVGTIVVAHGASPEWNALVRGVTRDVRTAGPVEVVFLMGPEAATTRFQDVAARLDGLGLSEIVVVPLLVSSHSSHYQQVRYLAGVTDSLDHALHAHMAHSGLEPARLRTPVRVARALDDSPVLAEVLGARAAALATEPSRQAVFLVAHGPNSAEDYAHWMANLRPVADAVRRAGGYADVRVDMVRDDAPVHVRAEAVRRVRELIELQHKVTQKPVVVVPVLISRGRVSRETFMADLAGLPVVYSGDPILPWKGLARWVEQRIAGDGAALMARPAAGATRNPGPG